MWPFGNEFPFVAEPLPEPGDTTPAGWLPCGDGNVRLQAPPFKEQ